MNNVIVPDEWPRNKKARFLVLVLSAIIALLIVTL
jgi:hypothetical protein